MSGSNQEHGDSTTAAIDAFKATVKSDIKFRYKELRKHITAADQRRQVKELGIRIGTSRFKLRTELLKHIAKKEREMKDWIRVEANNLSATMMLAVKPKLQDLSEKCNSRALGHDTVIMGLEMRVRLLEARLNRSSR